MVLSISDMGDFIQQLGYNPEEPLQFLSGFFLVFMSVFTVGYTMLNKNLNWRIIYVIVCSLYFYYKTSGLFYLLLVGLSLSDYTIGFFIHHSQNRKIRNILLISSLVINVGMLFYFKYTTLMTELFNSLFRGNLDFGDIFLPIGISFFSFQSMSYTIDIYRKEIKPVEKWWDYLFYLSFFPQLVAGPIVRAKDFIPQITRNPIRITKEEMGTGFFFIICGLLKKGVISNFISVNYVDRIFDYPLFYSGFENLMGIYGYALQIYCDFSGYSDIAIGIALLLGFHFKENFNSPYKAATITDFWRRWHISLSTWLRCYLYIPLGGNRKGKIRTYINLLLTMLIGGLWHGASWRFVAWGALHGVALSVHKLLMSKFAFFTPEGSKVLWRRILGIFVTFNIVCLGWVFFRAESYDLAIEMLSQIVYDFRGEIWLDFIRGYDKVFAILLLGYITHFVSDKHYSFIKKSFVKLPVVGYYSLFTIAVWIVLQFQGTSSQPFIYFQF